ncbi:MAG: carboxypeptidase-like regulatory domain-containing protein [bacterium]
MRTLSKKTVFFFVMAAFVALSLIPARGEATKISLEGKLINQQNFPIKNVYIFLYEWESAKANGLGMVPYVAITGNGKLTGTGATGPEGEFDVEIDLDLSREYLLIFSTRAYASAWSSTGANFPTFFYGANSNSDPSTGFKNYTGLDPTKAPRIKFTGGINFGNITIPVGNSIRGCIKNQAGNPLSGVRIELFMDNDGVPVPVPYPFYRFDTTYFEQNQTINFRLGGIQNGGKYYVKAIGYNIEQSEYGYIEDFYRDSGDKPQLITVSGTNTTKDIGDLRLTQGGKIYGYINDYEGTHAPNSIIAIQAVSYKDQQEQFRQSYVHDPNYDLYFDNDLLARITKWDRYYSRYVTSIGLEYFDFDASGYFEIKGLPFDDHEYYLIATEFPSGAPKKFATPVFYDGNDGVFSINDAQSVELPGSGTKVLKNIFLQEGACINGYVYLDEVPSEAAKTALGLDDPNIFGDLEQNLPLYIDAYRVERDGTILWLGQNVREGEGDFTLCGLTPGEFIVKAYDYPGIGLYPGEFFNDQPTYITATRFDVDIGDAIYIDTNIRLNLGGMLKGRVLDAGGSPIPNTRVFVNQINAGNPLVGYYFVNSEGAVMSQFPLFTDDDGWFRAAGLPAGYYTVFVNGTLENETTGYMPQFFDPEAGGTILANQADPFPFPGNDPNVRTLETMQLKQSGVETGGIISGVITVDSIVSSLVTVSDTAFFFHLYEAETGLEISNPLYTFNNATDTAIAYTIMVPSFGNYILSVQDAELKLLPHYYRSSSTTVNPTEAQSLPVTQAQPFLSDKNFLLSKRTGEVSGQALENGTGVEGVEVYARQEVLEGPDKGAWKVLAKAITDDNGDFTLKGLYAGTYIFSMYDTAVPTRYPSMYYHPTLELYVPEDADAAYTWEYVPGGSTPPSIQFSLNRGGTIKGEVDNVSRAQVYAYLMIDDKPSIGYSAIADPNFTLSGLTPGPYVLTFRDPNLNYVSMYYTLAGVTVNPDLVDPDDLIVQKGATIDVGTLGFYQSSARIEGNVTHLGIDTLLYLFLYRMTEKKDFWASKPEQFSQIDENGNYILDGLSKGEYKIIAFGPNTRPIAKSVNITDDDLGSSTVVDITFPTGWVNQKYEMDVAIEKGMNLSAYPMRIPPYVSGYTSVSFLKDIIIVNSRMSMSIRAFSADEQTWKSASFGDMPLEGFQMTGTSGNNFYLYNGQGFMLYAEKPSSLRFRYFPGQTPLRLLKGMNLVGNVPFNPDLADVDDPNFIDVASYSTRRMLSDLGEDAVSIRTFNAREGRWQSTYRMWGRSSGPDVPVKEERGYLVTVKEDIINWYPTK